MTAFEVLYFNKDLLKRLFELGLKISDYKYVDLYIDYENMYNKGYKVIYIVTVLSSKYRISEREIYKIINRMNINKNLFSIQVVFNESMKRLEYWEIF